MKQLITYLFFASCLIGCNMKYEFSEDQKKYIGNWKNPDAHINISNSGRVDYKSNLEGMSKEIQGPIKEFDGDNFVVGLAFMSTTFVVDTPPKITNLGIWKMTVDGHDYYKQIEIGELQKKLPSLEESQKLYSETISHLRRSFENKDLKIFKDISSKELSSQLDSTAIASLFVFTLLDSIKYHNFNDGFVTVNLFGHRADFLEANKQLEFQYTQEDEKWKLNYYSFRNIPEINDRNYALTRQ